MPCWLLSSVGMESMTEAVPYTLLQETFEPEAGDVFGCVLLCAALPWTEPFWGKCYLWGRPGGDSSRCLPPQAVTANHLEGLFPQPSLQGGAVVFHRCIPCFCTALGGNLVGQPALWSVCRRSAGQR